MKRAKMWLAVCVVGMAGSVLAGPAMWTSEGPYGGAVYRLYANPAVPNVLYASTRGGIFRSSDGGVSWSRKEAGLSGAVAYNYALAMDADAPAVLWVTDSFGHFNRSTDGGDNWAQTGYTFASGTAINHVADAPGSVGKLFAATSAGVMASSDSGASFLPSSSGLPSGVPINYLAVDPANPLRVLAGTSYPSTAGDTLHPETLYRSSDGGATWSGVLAVGGSIPSALYYGHVVDISFGAGSTVYAVVDLQLWRSDNDGASWNGPLPVSGLRGVQAVSADPTAANTVLIGSHSGVSRSTDGGATSAPFGSAIVVAGTNLATATRFAPHPNYPATNKVWVGTTDAGIHFYDSTSGNWLAQNDGLAATNIRALAMFHDLSTHRLFAGYGDATRPSPALYRGNNSGPGTPFLSWAPANTGLSALQIRSVTIDPTTRASGIGSTRLYATGRAGASSADTAVARNGGIYRSTDGGSTWSSIDAGLPTFGTPPTPWVSTVRSLALDPRSCAAPPSPPNPCTTGPLQTLYATATGRTGGPGGTNWFRVMRSTNGGDTWATRDNGIPQPDNGVMPNGEDAQIPLIVPIVVNPANPQELYVGGSLQYDPAVVAVPSVPNGVFKSIDGGASWFLQSNGLPLRAGSASTAFDVLSLAINPANPQELWCSVVDINNGFANGGIYHTVNGGATWSNASGGLTSADIRVIHVDPANPAIVYASGGGTDGNPGGVYKSINSGASWLSISSGLPADAALSLQLDPVDSSVLYAGTNTGVWSITQLPDADGDGVPDAVENAAPNGGDGNNDGTDDAAQSAVGSLVSPDVGAGLAGMDAPTAPQYFTVSITPVAGACAQAMDEQSVYAAYHANDVSSYGDNYSYPRQLARFEIQNCQKATVKLKFHGSTFAGGYNFRFYGPSTPGDPATMGWYDFGSRATQISPDTWQLTLDNGQFGSYRPASANSILFEGGPGTHEGIFRNGFD